MAVNFELQKNELCDRITLIQNQDVTQNITGKTHG